MKYLIIALAVLLLAPAALVADPTPRHNEQGTERRPRPPWFPTGKDRYWVFTPNPADPAGALPWMRNWLEHPHEEDAPGDIFLPPG
jgi:hypothetical protein